MHKEDKKTYIYIYTHIHMYIHIHMYAYIYIYIYTNSLLQRNFPEGLGFRDKDTITYSVETRRTRRHPTHSVAAN